MTQWRTKPLSLRKKRRKFTERPMAVELDECGDAEDALLVGPLWTRGEVGMQGVAATLDVSTGRRQWSASGRSRIPVGDAAVTPFDGEFSAIKSSKNDHSHVLFFEKRDAPGRGTDVGCNLIHCLALWASRLPGFLKRTEIGSF